MVTGSMHTGAKKTINALLHREDRFPFRAAIIRLHQKFEIPVEDSTSFQIFNDFLEGMEDINHTEELITIAQNYYPCRAIFNFMVKVGDITTEMLTERFPEGESRQKLDEWIDGECSYS